jgi:hypothetical protein
VRAPQRRAFLLLRLAKAAEGRELGAAADAELAARIRAFHDAGNTIGAPCVTTELDDGVTAGQRVNRGSASTGNAQARHPRLPEAETVRTNDRPGAGRSESARAAQAQLDRGSAEPALRRRHHLSVVRHSPVPVVQCYDHPARSRWALGRCHCGAGDQLSALAAFFVGDLSKGVRLFARNLSGKVHDGDGFSARYHDGAR